MHFILCKDLPKLNTATKTDLVGVSIILYYVFYQKVLNNNYKLLHPLLNNLLKNKILIIKFLLFYHINTLPK